MVLPTGRTPQIQPRRTASTPAWKRVSTPSSVINAATRRRTVRRLMPSLRAISSSWAPATSCSSRKRRRSGRASPVSRRGHRGRGRPQRLEPHGQRRDDRALPDVHPRLVGEAERLGQDRVGVAEDEHAGRQLGHHPDLLPSRARVRRASRRLVERAHRVDRPGPAAAGHRLGEQGADRRLPRHRPRVRSQPEHVAPTRAQHLPSISSGLPPRAQLAVEGADLRELGVVGSRVARRPGAAPPRTARRAGRR